MFNYSGILQKFLVILEINPQEFLEISAPLNHLEYIFFKTIKSNTTHLRKIMLKILENKIEIKNEITAKLEVSNSHQVRSLKILSKIILRKKS